MREPGEWINWYMLCPGCLGEFEAAEGPVHAYILSAPGCWAAYGEVLAREYSESRLMRLHRLTVDAYAVQHPGMNGPQARRSVGIHLSRIYLYLERGWAMERVNAAMPAISAAKDRREWLEPPSMLGTINVLAFSKMVTVAEHEALLEAWAGSVWKAWTPHHATVVQWCAELQG